MISWFEAAQFVNWLNTDSGSTRSLQVRQRRTFQLWTPGDAGYNPNNLYRNSQATYFLPSVDEWYKAAYYDPNSGAYYDYPTGSDTAPTAVASGTAVNTAYTTFNLFDDGSAADITARRRIEPLRHDGPGRQCLGMGRDRL